MKVSERLSLWCPSKLLLFDLKTGFFLLNINLIKATRKSVELNGIVNGLNLLPFRSCWRSLKRLVFTHSHGLHIKGELAEGQIHSTCLPSSLWWCGAQLDMINNCCRLASRAQAHFNFRDDALRCTRQKKTQRGTFNDGFLRESFVIVMYCKDFHSGGTQSRTGWKWVIN